MVGSLRLEGVGGVLAEPAGSCLTPEVLPGYGCSVSVRHGWKLWPAVLKGGDEECDEREDQEQNHDECGYRDRERNGGNEEMDSQLGFQLACP